MTQGCHLQDHLRLWSPPREDHKRPLQCPSPYLVSKIVPSKFHGEPYLLLVVLEKIDMLQVWMELDLVDSWRNTARLENPVKLFWEIVADTDRFRESLSFQLFHLLPFFLVVLFLLAEERSMDEIPIL